MTKQFFILIILLFVSSDYLTAQYLMNEKEILSKNDVKALIVKNCDTVGCFKDYYEFDKFGNIIKEIPPLIGCYFEYEYNLNGKKMLRTWVKKKNYGAQNKDSIDSEGILKYDLKNKFKYTIWTYYEKGEKVGGQGTTFQNINEPKLRNFEKDKKNSKGQIVELITDLIVPCEGNVGSHKYRYEYAQNGLISKTSIYSFDSKQLYELTYEYEYYK